MHCPICDAPGQCSCAKPEPHTLSSCAKPEPHTLTSVLWEIGAEVQTAEDQWPPMNSAHEAYAVLLEEVDELWEHVKTKQSKRDIPAMRREALQVAAMAVRFARDVCDGGRGRA